MPTEPLVIEKYEGPIPGHGVLRLKGPLVAENVPPFQNAVRGDDTDTMIVDLTHVPYVDSAGLGSLVAAYVSRNKAGQRVAFAGLNPRVLKLFEVTRVEPLFLIFPTLADAVTGMSTAAEA
ncbi:MAG: STAS domain-containing protein [Acidobacteriales bacterium]|nr:STAS domain-containing protein [Terriglobales bacterium]